MAYEDPREHKREIEDDQRTSHDREKETKTDDDDQGDEYRYTDWASI